jgi:hypothetical protein
MARKTISLAIVLASFTIVACTGDQSRKNVCPIDGQPAMGGTKEREILRVLPL